MIANYHTHTKWCHHGVGEIEDYVRYAYEIGMEEIAITEHVPHKNNDHDYARMYFHEFEAYNAELDQIIEKYAGKIRVIKGMECEYYPEEMNWYETLRHNYGYELMLLGQHMSGPRPRVDNFYAKPASQLECYVREVTEGLATGMFDCFVHPDLILQDYNDNRWDEISDRVCHKLFQACERYKIPVEINANGFRNRMRYPDIRAFEISKDYDLVYLVNSDAHKPERLNDRHVTRAFDFAEELGVKVLERFDFERRRLERLALIEDKNR